jgi:signal peptidase I
VPTANRPGCVFPMTSIGIDNKSIIAA